MFVGIYFLFVICMCGLIVVATMVVLRVNNHAQSKPLVAMPSWVRSISSVAQSNPQVLKYLKISPEMHYSVIFGCKCPHFLIFVFIHKEVYFE